MGCIPFLQNYYSGASRKVVGCQGEGSNGETIKAGNWKYYWKNGQVMDSLVFDDTGQEIYRARFSKTGVLSFESDTEKKIVYDKNGNVLSTINK